MTIFPKMDILYPCSLCSQTFVLKKNVLMHMKTFHKSYPTQHDKKDQSNDVPLIDSESLFACSICSKPFSSKGLLKTHMYLKHKVPIKDLTSHLMNESRVSHKLNDNLFLKDLLPDNYTYKILSFKDLLCGHFKTKFEISNMDKKSFFEWLYCLCYKSKVHYTSQVLQSNSMESVFRNVYKCKSIDYWNRTTNSILQNPTYCKASLSVVITYNKLAHQSNAVILIKHCHCHPMNHFTLLTLYPDIRIVYNQLTSSLYNGLTAADVLYKYKMHIIQNHGKEHYLNSINTRVKPDVEFVYDLYYMINGKSGFPSPFSKLLESLIKSVSYYNDCTRKESAAIKLVENDIVLAIRTPLKEIANTDMIFLCSTNFNFCKTWFMFSKNNKKISIPVGIIIATKDNECMLKTGLILWKELGGNVKTVMVEFIHTLTFQSVFPKATIYVSKFHFLLSVWKWLFNSTDKWNDDELNCFIDLKKKICSENFAKDFDINLALGLIETYPHFNEFMQNILKSKFLFCSPPITNPCTIFERKLIYYHTKSFSILQMFHFVIDEIDLFYDLSTNSPNNLQISLNDLNEAEEEEDNFKYFCFANNCSMYLVESDEDKFFVDMDIGLCSCTINNNSMCFNGPCIHQVFLNNNDVTLKHLMNVYEFDTLNTSNNNDLGEEITEKKEFESILSEFRYVSNKIREQFITDPNYFKSGIQSFVSELTNNLKSEKSLLLACCSLKKLA